jgi:hypothetical protein
VLSRTVQAGLATVRTRMEDLEAAAAASDGEEEEEGGAAGAEQLARLSQKLNELGPTPHHRPTAPPPHRPRAPRKRVHGSACWPAARP